MIPGDGPNHPSFRKSFLIAIQGFRTAVREERNIKVMLCGGVFAIVMCTVLRVDLLGWAVVMLTCGTVIAAELLNTSIEAVVDLVSPEYHPMARKAKDIAAAAVWALCVIVVVVGLLVFGRAILANMGVVAS